MKLESEEQGSSLYFGSAIDASITALLEGDPNWRAKFFDRWKTAVSGGKFIKLFDNPSIVYAHSDFDGDILNEQDLNYMKAWMLEMGLEGKDPVEVFKDVAKSKKNPYKKTSIEELIYFSRCSWLSLNRKGEILIEAFYNQFYPKIKKVIATQKHANLKDESTGDSIVGVIDMVIEYEGYDKPIIFDLKTAASPYDKDQLDVSDQLTLYAAMKGGEYSTDLVGYVVLCKNIPKEIQSTCSKCGYKKQGRYQTCNNDAGNVSGRCGGDWIEKKIPKPEVQVLVDSKSPLQVESLLVDMANVITSMKNGLVFKNTQHCHNWYGSSCPYLNLCHKGSKEGLKCKGE